MMCVTDILKYKMSQIHQFLRLQRVYQNLKHEFPDFYRLSRFDFINLRVSGMKKICIAHFIVFKLLNIVDDLGNPSKII